MFFVEIVLILLIGPNLQIKLTCKLYHIVGEKSRWKGVDKLDHIWLNMNIRTDNYYQGLTRSDGISTPGTGIDVYAGGGKTTNIKTINIFDEFDKLYRKVMAW